MKIKETFQRKIFNIVNVSLLSLITIICILPFVHLLAVSFSSSLAAAAGEVKLIPKGFTFEAYKYLSAKPAFFRSVVISTERVLLGTVVNMIMVIITAYPLSKEVHRFRARTAYAWFFAFTLFFSGGMIPSYIVVKETGLINSIWSLVLPGALSVWNTVMLLNFFRQVPKDLEEAAIIDGASQWTILWKIYLPVSTAAIATILLFSAVWHWNSWFDGILYINSPTKYPLQSYISTLINNMNSQSMKTLTKEEFERLKKITEKTLEAAQIFLGALPILLVFPFLQRFFIKGIMVGSVKG